MDLNLAVLAGRLATTPELRTFDSGARLVRVLVTVRSERPTPRIDVVPVCLWDPPEDLADAAAADRVWVSGRVQRRFQDGPEGRRSRLEVVADQVVLRASDPPHPEDA